MPHTAANFGGGPYFINPKSGSAVKNNGGTVFYGGTPAANSPITVSTPLSTMGFRAGISEAGPQLNTDQNIGCTTVKSGINFATMVAGQYILFGYSSKVGGSANTILQVGGSMGQKRSQNYALKYVRTNHYVLDSVNGGSSGWNYITGLPATNPSVMSTDTVNEEAYMGTWLIPGRLTTLSTGKTPVTASYPRKTD